MSNRGKEGKRGAAIELAAGAVRATRSRWVVLFILCLLYLISYLDRTAISVTAPEMIKEFRFSKTQMGLIFSAFFIPYGFCKLSGGPPGIITAPEGY